MGTVLAVAVVVAALTFAGSLSTLVSHPPLYGWNWDYMFSTTNDVPPQSLRALSHDPDVAAWSGADLVPFQIDGQFVPSVVASPHARVAPPVLSGHGLDADNQVVLGSATLAELHKHVGDTVYLSEGTPRSAPFYIPPTPLVVVGTATFPAIGYSSIIASHPSMGTGALVPSAVEPPAWQRAQASPDPILNGPQYVFVRLAKGRERHRRAGRPATHRRRRQPGHRRRPPGRRATTASASWACSARPRSSTTAASGPPRWSWPPGSPPGPSSPSASPSPPRSAAVAGTWPCSRALGFTRRQLSAAIAWQSTVAAVIGVVVGTPLGIVIGRQLWILFAHNLSAVPDPTTPLLSVVLVVLGALVFANLVAAFPGRTASRTPTALVLRTE